MAKNTPIIGLHLGAGGGACIGNFDTLADLQKGVGGWIEVYDVNLPKYAGRVSMYCNEESKLNGLPVNSLATSLFRLTFYDDAHIAAERPMDYISGDVVFTGLPDDDGETQSLPVEAGAALDELLAFYRR